MPVDEIGAHPTVATWARLAVANVGFAVFPGKTSGARALVVVCFSFFALAIVLARFFLAGAQRVLAVLSGVTAGARAGPAAHFRGALPIVLARPLLAWIDAFALVAIFALAPGAHELRVVPLKGRRAPVQAACVQFTLLAKERVGASARVVVFGRM